MTDLVPVTKTVRETREHLETFLRTAHLRGRLLTDPRDLVPVRLADGRFQVEIRMLMPPERLTRRARLARWSKRHDVLSAMLKALAFGLVITLVVGGLLVALFLVVINSIGAGAFFAAGVLLLLLGAGSLFSRRRGHSEHDGYGFHWTKCK